MDSSLIQSKKLIETHVGWVPPQIMESRVEGRLVRRQQIIGPNRFTLIIRHTAVATQHLCGYIHVDRDLMHEIVSYDEALPTITYHGPGTRDISWRWFNSARKLVTVGKVNHGDEQDYWIGMDFPADCTEEDAIVRVNALESVVDFARKARQ